jgi:hypothetical protein
MIDYGNRITSKENVTSAKNVILNFLKKYFMVLISENKNSGKDTNFWPCGFLRKLSGLGMMGLVSAEPLIFGDQIW